jgi:hypothetical protein
MSLRKDIEKWATDSKILVVTSMMETNGKKYVPVDMVWSIIKCMEKLL